MAMRNGRSESGMDAIAYRLAAPRVAAQALAWILLVILVYSGSVTTPAPLRAPRYASRSLTGIIGAAAAGCACAAGCAALSVLHPLDPPLNGVGETVEEVLTGRSLDELPGSSVPPVMAVVADRPSLCVNRGAALLSQCLAVAHNLIASADPPVSWNVHLS